MDITDPSGLITEGHRFVQRGAALATAATTVPVPDLGFHTTLVQDALSSLVDASGSLVDGLSDTGDDLVVTARLFVSHDGQVGEHFERFLLGGRFR